MPDTAQQIAALNQRISTALEESISWREIDCVLLRLCEAYPKHDDESQVIAKVALIGRTYATGIERAFKGGKKQGDALGKVVKHIHLNGAKLDAIISSVPAGTNELTENAIRSIVEAHFRFIELLQTCEDCQKTPRSFVSKYLHFHRPNVPIYDSYAAGIISKLLGKSTQLRMRHEASDYDYARYVEKFWLLQERIFGAGERRSVKELDTYILWEAYESDQLGVEHTGEA
ncbi:hypothetical protein BH10PSE6_BH10PSE6_36330 [soil metagenome]